MATIAHPIYQTKFLYLKRFLSVFLLAPAITTIAQNDTSKTVKPFDNGILIENIGVTIPWGIQTSKLIKIDTLKGRYLNVLWDGVTFLGGVKGSIKCNPKKKGISKLFHLYASIDNSDFEKAVLYCNTNIYAQPEHKKWRGKYLQYIWTTDNILVQIIQGEYFTFIYIARVQKTAYNK